MIIRELKDIDMLEAIQLKALCYSEELAGLSNNKLNIDIEYQFWMDWMHTGIEHNDVRVLIGAFENKKMLGVLFASFSENEDSCCGMELNGLWVYPEARGRGVSLKLMSKVLEYYQTLEKREIIIYNFHHSPSNTYYKKFGANIIKTEYQIDEKIPTDVFKCEISLMLNNIQHCLSKYPSNINN